MDTVMVLSVLNGGLPITPVVENGTDMKRTCVPNDKRELALGLTNSLTDSPNIFEKGKALYKRKET